ncbi:GntR family transcriptional regulator [Nereida sp. MMG025]|uniref:GntR family transcriptional regulator n=1 Tax=Nereida sp. MMG025 TaxID=2909981 RepID=UPI001F189C1D|nr:GntR family transcriptional regulator [Nereida sp. MMG025]MCF6445391.1 GntR family transcriptional regulator [Nereida sp. MMG025]
MQSARLPKYLALAEMLTREIAAGHLPDGLPLPPEREMAANLGVSVGTLRKALDTLETQGALDRVQGSGNYVRASGANRSVYGMLRLEKRGGGGLPTADVLSVDVLPKPARAPAFGPSAQGHRIRRLRRLDDDPVALEEIWLDGDAALPFAAADLKDALYLFYKDALGIVIARAEDRVGVAQVPDWRVDAFSPAIGHRVGYIERVGKLADGRPVEYSRTWFDDTKAAYINRI